MGKEKFVFIGFTAALGLVLIPIYVVPKINPDAYSKLIINQVAKFQHQQRKYKLAENQFLFFDFFMFALQKNQWICSANIMTEFALLLDVAHCYYNRLGIHFSRDEIPQLKPFIVMMELEASQKKHNHSASRNCCTLSKNIIITN